MFRTFIVLLSWVEFLRYVRLGLTIKYPYSAHRVIFQSESRPLEHGFLNSFFADLHDVLNTLEGLKPQSHCK
jgi:hypothetical protein